MYVYVCFLYIYVCIQPTYHWVVRVFLSDPIFNATLDREVSQHMSWHDWQQLVENASNWWMTQVPDLFQRLERLDADADDASSSDNGQGLHENGSERGDDAQNEREQTFEQREGSSSQKSQHAEDINAGDGEEAAAKEKQPNKVDNTSRQRSKQEL